MPPKRGGAGGARRGRPRTGRARGNAHVRMLSDITEETESSSGNTRTRAAAAAAAAATKHSGGKKRTFDQANIESQAESTNNNGRRETRSNSAKRAKTAYEFTAGPSVEPKPVPVPVATTTSKGPEIYTPTPALLYFTTVGNLDTSPETESIAMDLIKLTLQPENWHPGLSGMLQPAACFLVASLLTRRQNLVEDVAAAVETFGITYEELVNAYQLVWDWRINLVEVSGAYAENIDSLPAPDLFLAGDGAQDGPQTINDAEEETWDTWEDEAAEDRPEPEREA